MTLKILIVEDDVSTRRLEQMILERAGYEVIEASHAETALQTLQEQHVDVIVLDILMPEMSGIDLLKKLKGNPLTARIPVILCTSVSEQHYVQEALSIGINGYILKPIKAKDVVVKIQQAMKKVEPVLEDPAKTTVKLGLDSQGYRQLLYLLIDDGRDRLKIIGTKVEAGDISDFLMFARDLSSSAENLGANSLHRVALDATSAVPNADKSVREKYFFKIRAEIERLSEVVSQLQ